MSDTFTLSGVELADIPVAPPISYSASYPLTLTSRADSVTVNGKTTRTSFDKASMTVTTSTPMGKTVKRKIDQQGRVTQLSLTGLLPIDYTYDIKGRMSAATQGTRTTSYAYDPSGNLSGVTDAAGRVTTFGYDPAGRMTSQTLFDGRVVSLSYDANGNVTSITPPSRPAHSFTYTPVNLESSYNPPDIGIGNVATTYAYNLDKQITSVTRPDGQSINYSYDTAGRLSSIALPGASIGIGYTSGIGCCGGPSSIAAIVRTPSSGAAQRLDYTYDGSLMTSESWSGLINATLTATHNSDQHITSRSINGANTVNFSYDNDGGVTIAGAMTIARNSQNGSITGTTLGATTTAHTNDQYGELSAFTASKSGAAILSVSYSRDVLGRITRKIETSEGVSTTYDYAYDTAGRLAGASKNGAQVSSYVYDSNSNRTTTTVNGVTTQAFYDSQDRLISYGGNTYAYTPNGELLAKTSNGQTTSYNYDVLGNFLGVTLPDGTTVEYVVDGRNRRVGKIVNGALTQGFVYAGYTEPVAELDGYGNVISVFVYGTKPHSPDYMVKNGVTYRILSDHAGSPRLVLNTSDGAIVQKMEYDEWGNVTLDTNPGFQPFGFAGGIYDQHTKLTRFGARDYDAERGRWMSKDPIGFDGQDPNLYGYVLADPINSIDPLGLKVNCTYSQTSGRLICEDEEEGGEVINTKCYSGRGDGKNNPDMQDVRDTGPLTRGDWEFGEKGYDHPVLGPQTISMHPKEGNDIYDTDRDPNSIRVHGDSEAHPGEASKGCLVCDRKTRDKISSEGGGTVKVTR